MGETKGIKAEWHGGITWRRWRLSFWRGELAWLLQIGPLWVQWSRWAAYEAEKARRKTAHETTRDAFWGEVADKWQRYKEQKRDGLLPPRASPTIDDWTTDYSGVRLADAAAGQPGGPWRVTPGQERPLTQAEYEALPKKEVAP